MAALLAHPKLEIPTSLLINPLMSAVEGYHLDIVKMMLDDPKIYSFGIAAASCHQTQQVNDQAS